MRGPRGMFTKFRSGNMPFFALRTPLSGCGFALAFGWLWFPALRDVLLQGLFAGGPSFHPSAFGLALGAGCFLYGLLCGRLENSNARHRLLNAALAHGVPLLLLGLLLLSRGMDLSFAMLDGMLVGLAGALPGVWWTSRLLASGPGKAVSSLAWAAFITLALSLPLSWIQPGSTVTVCVLAASLALACLAALFLVSGKRERYEEDARPDTAVPLESPHRFGPFRGMYAVLLCGVAPIFFGIGSLSVLVQGTDEILQAIAQLCALIVAVFILDGPLERTLDISACTLAVLAFCLSPSPELAPMLYPVGAGLLEAAAVVLCAAALRREAFGQDTTAFVAGLLLTVTLTAVNVGELAGWELVSFTGEAWPVLPGLVAALLLAAAAYQGRKSMTGTEAAQGEAEQELPLAHATSGKISSTATTVSPPITEQLTKREQTVATLLANGYNTKDAAKSLGMAENTLRWHIKNIHKKTGTANRTEMVALLKKVKATNG